ncbi:extracellular solute-binding protein [Streptomyces sp. ACA25]|uniref:extracellular solute-binding protein n=1 Tax=Streptomyces sp. ACA25 TaxID=3022596 RepID=UPI0023081F3A|nr:extracellular solute-binding protein [Streptomyces sp. ACA25]MDB1087863.1 extracellular solute-binding protein [Streptomyces sp. ACA25]
MRASISVKKRATAAAALAFFLTLPGCGTLSGPQEPDPRDVSGRVTWWDTSNETEAPLFNQLVAAFEKEYPSVDVTYVNVPFFDAQQQFLEAAREGAAPDVLRADVGWTAGFVDAGLLADLTGTPAAPEPTEFLENTVAGVTFHGGVYGIPQVTDTLALLYNKRILEEAGLSRPPRDWEELREHALTVRSTTDAEGIVLNTDAYFALPFLYGERSDLIDPDRNAITVASPASVRGVTAAADLVESGAAPMPPAEDAYGEMQGTFKQGGAAMMINGPWAVTELFDSSTFADRNNLGIVPVPAGSTGTAGSPTGGHNLVVSAHTESPEAAQLFARFMTDTAQQEKAAVALGLLPARKAAYTEDVLSDPVRNSFYFAHTKSVSRVPLVEGAEMFAAFQEHYTAILRGERSVTEGLLDTAHSWRADLLPGWTVDE